MRQETHPCLGHCSDPVAAVRLKILELRCRNAGATFSREWICCDVNSDPRTIAAGNIVPQLPASRLCDRCFQEADACRRPPRYSFLFSSFFPQLIAGPIERPNHLIPQLERAGLVAREDVSPALQLFLYGLILKLPIADVLVGKRLQKLTARQYPRMAAPSCSLGRRYSTYRFTAISPDTH